MSSIQTKTNRDLDTLLIERINEAKESIINKICSNKELVSFIKKQSSDKTGMEILICLLPHHTEEAIKIAGKRRRSLSRLLYKLTSTPFKDFVMPSIRQLDTLETQLLQSNKSNIFTIARKFMGQGLPLEDLIQEGNIGLLEAIEGFDPTKGCKFITYARWWVVKEIWNGLKKSTDRGTAQNTAEALNMLKDNGLTPEAKAELADSLEGTPLSTCMFVEDIDVLRPLYEDLIEDETEQNIEALDNWRSIEMVLDQLPPKHKEMLLDRYGMDGRTALTFNELGSKYQVTYQAAQQTVNKILKVLKIYLYNISK